MADRLGLSPTIAYVRGDDLLPRLGELVAAGVDLAHLETGEPIGDPSRFLTANAYLGCWGIVDALARGADIVITGRVTDAAVVCGPAAWHHGWARDDWDALAGRRRRRPRDRVRHPGHRRQLLVLHRGARPRRAPGFPWAEVAADGSSVIGKHDGTGGEVSVGTVTSQLLYEIGGPAYLGPDVTARFDTIELEQVAPDRVRISGTKGEPPPATLKVAMNELGGFRNDITVALTGLDIEAKAALVEEAFWEACPYGAGRLRQRHDEPGPHRQARPGDQRGGRRPLADQREGPRRAQGRPGLLERGDRAGAGQHPRLLRPRRRALRRPALRRVPAGPGAGGPRAAARGGARRRRDDGGLRRPRRRCERHGPTRARRHRPQR